MTTKPNHRGTASGDRPLRVAVPNKGSLSQSAQEILRERRMSDELIEALKQAIGEFKQTTTIESA